jgi:hypothetical protein
VTFADIKGVDEAGKPIPVESVITGSDDVCTCQCLDYIFVINRNKSVKHKVINMPSLSSRNPEEPILYTPSKPLHPD